VKRRMVLGLPVLAAAALAGCGRPGEGDLRAGIRDLAADRPVRARARLERFIAARPGDPNVAAAKNLLGVACWRLGDTEAAAAAFRESQRLDPARGAPLYNLAVLLEKGGDAVRAAALLEEAALIPGGFAPAEERLAGLHAKQERWLDARQRLRAALEHAGPTPRVLTALGAVELRLSGHVAAIYYLMKALEREPEYAPALYNLMVIYRDRLRDPGPARAMADRLARVERDAGRLAEARRLMGETPAAPTPEAPSPTPSPPGSARAPAPEAHPDAWLDEARRAAREGRSAAAMALCLRAAEAARAAGDAARRERALAAAVDLAPDQAPAHVALAQHRAEAGRREEALAAYLKAGRLDPRSLDAALGAADAAIALREYDAAALSLKRAVAIDPDHADAAWRLALLYDESLRMTEEAVRQYRRFAQLFPEDARVARAAGRVKALAPSESPSIHSEPTPAAAAVPTPSAGGRRIEWKASATRDTPAAVKAYNRGADLQRQGDLDRALYYYLRALESDSRFVPAFFNLGSLYRERSDPELAKDAYRRALEIQPDNAAARYNLAILHFQLKERAEASAQLRELLSRQPGHAAGHYLMGLILAADASTRDAARREFEEFLRLAPDDPAAEAVRRWMGGGNG